MDLTGGSSGTSGVITEKNPDGSTTQIKTGKDGTVTTTQKDAQGNQTQTVEKTDGSKEITVKQKDGTKAAVSVDQSGTVTANVDLSKKAIDEAAKQGEAIQLPIPAVKPEKESTASAVTVELPKGSGKTQVVIPVTEQTPGTVAVVVQPDGTQTVIVQSKLTGNGVAVTLEEGATLKIVDNSRQFKDVKQDDWFCGAVDFVSSRELFVGTGEGKFEPDTSMTMEMLFAVVHNFMGKPEAVGKESVPGTTPEDWFYDASKWAIEAGLTRGLETEMLGSNQSISREDTALVLFNLYGNTGYTPGAQTLAKLDAFSDIGEMNPANRIALAWAVEHGIMNGMNDGSFGFKGSNTRSQTSAVMMNVCRNLY